MEKYNYKEAVKRNVKEELECNYAEELESYINGDIDRDDFIDILDEGMFVCDGVTGNASGSYTFNAYQAEENICHNLDLLGEALEDFGSDMDVLKSGAEACDVTIRCYLLRGCIEEVVDEYEVVTD